jgi:hypothetical protein
MYRYRIFIGPCGIHETVRRLDDANQSTHLGRFQDLGDGTEHVRFTHPSPDEHAVTLELRAVLGYEPLTVRNLGEAPRPDWICGRCGTGGTWAKAGPDACPCAGATP